MQHRAPFRAFTSARPASLVLLASLCVAPAQALGGGDPPNVEEDVERLAQEAAPAPGGLRNALTGGNVWLKLRLRQEEVDQKGFSKNAHATTLRTVLGYETLPFHGFTGLLEFEDVRAIPNSDGYASPTNGVTDRPLVADPEGTEVNQALLRYRWDERGAAHVGRQRILLDNQRWVGNVGWRQNEQTFDAGKLDLGLPAAIDLSYVYLDNVNTIFGEFSAADNAPQDSHLLNAQHVFAGWGTLALYDYFLDYTHSPATSTNSLGARFSGKRDLSERANLAYALEYANQTDAADNPGDFDLDYTLLELGGGVGLVSGTVGWEVLGGDGTNAVQTPLATKFAFNGWADKFLATPADGLEDLYVKLGVKISKGRLEVAYHDFSADSSSADFGSEIDAHFSWPLTKGVVAGIKYADYSEGDLITAVDTTKGWLWLEASF